MSCFSAEANFAAQYHLYQIQTTANQITRSIAFRLPYYSVQRNQTLVEDNDVSLDALHYIGFASMYASRYCMFSAVQRDLNHLQPPLNSFIRASLLNYAKYEE